MNKRVGNRYIEKKVLVRVEHVNPSKSRDEFLQRVKQNAERAKGAKVDKGTYSRRVCSYLASSFMLIM